MGGFERLDNLTLSDVDAEQMKKLEKAVIDALLPFKANTDPLYAVLALTRCLRVMLRAAPKPAVKQLLPVLEDYLRGRNTPRHEGLLWLPGEPRN